MRIPLIVVSLLIAIAASAQMTAPATAQLSSTVSALGSPWAMISRDFVSLAEAMPADKYDFVPTMGEFAGVRSFGQQVKHVACANYAFFNQIEGKKPSEACWEGGPSPAKTKDEILQYLRDSFAYGTKVISALDQKSLLDVVEGPYAGPRSKMGMVTIAVWHASDHYGQLIVYLRMNGIVPPASRR